MFLILSKFLFENKYLFLNEFVYFISLILVENVCGERISEILDLS